MRNHKPLSYPGVFQGFYLYHSQLYVCLLIKSEEGSIVIITVDKDDILFELLTANIFPNVADLTRVPE